MFELPEYVILANQMNDTLPGKLIQAGNLGNSPHKFVWYNRTPAEFAELTCGRAAGRAYAKGRWLFLPVEPGYVLVLGECGGKVLYHAPGEKHPEKYHLLITFEDDSALTVTTQMWGAMELFATGEELNRQYIKDMRATPIDTAFTYDYFFGLVDEYSRLEKRSVKSLLTQDQIIPGLGNAIAQDILFQARLHPRHSIDKLDDGQKRELYEAIQETVQQVIARGGRYDETDLFGQPGGYVRLMDKNSAGKPCPVCGAPVEKIQYLGGACYLCPECQK